MQQLKVSGWWDKNVYRCILSYFKILLHWAERSRRLHTSHFVNRLKIKKSTAIACELLTGKKRETNKCGGFKTQKNIETINVKQDGGLMRENKGS